MSFFMKEIEIARAGRPGASVFVLARIFHEAVFGGSIMKARPVLAVLG
jgi:hypothetical protein